MASTDRFVSGDLDKDGKDELIGLSNMGYCHVMRFTGTGWQTLWTNVGNGLIHQWAMSSDDKFFIGDFNGDGKEELLTVNLRLEKAGLMSFGGTAWTTLWSDASGIIHWWYLNPEDQFQVGDFNGDGKDDWMAFNTGTKYSHLMTFNGTSWYTNWGNSGLGFLHNAGRFIAGEFYGNNEASLLSFAYNANGKVYHWTYLKRFVVP